MVYPVLLKAPSWSLWLFNWLRLAKSGTFQGPYRPLAIYLSAQAAIHLIAINMNSKSGVRVTPRQCEPQLLFKRFMEKDRELEQMEIRFRQRV